MVKEFVVRLSSKRVDTPYFLCRSLKKILPPFPFSGHNNIIDFLCKKAFSQISMFAFLLRNNK